MKQQFVETIKIKNGKALALPYHQARMERTIRRFFPSIASEEINLSSLISPKEEMNFYKARVVYGAQGVEAIEYAPYKMKEIHSLKVVEDDSIDYTYKSTDRSALNALVAQKGDCDEIIIVKNGLITDTSFTNLALFDGKKWLTPKASSAPGYQACPASGNRHHRGSRPHTRRPQEGRKSEPLQRHDRFRRAGSGNPENPIAQSLPNHPERRFYP